MKERIEDLGRLYERLKRISDNDVFDLQNQRPKDFVDWFYTQSKETQEGFLRSMAYQVHDIQEQICECITIARGDEE